MQLATRNGELRVDDKDILYEVAKLSQFDACESIWWRINADSSSEATGLRVLVGCNDLFEWGTADCEEVTEENLPTLRQAVADCRRVSGSEYRNQSDAFLLFCCRVRGERPQGAYYKHLNVHYSVPDGLNEAGYPKRRKDDDESDKRTAELRALFDACGPERDVGLFNPHPQPSAVSVEGL